MRFGLYIPQGAIVQAKLLGRVTTDAWLVLDYLRRWASCKNVKTLQIGNRDFFWIKYSQACRELPILFRRRPTLPTQRNKMVKLVASLKSCGLIQTARAGSRCYIHLTETAQAMYGKPSPQKRFEMDNVTSDNDGAVMVKRDAPVMRNRDGKEEQYKTELEERCYTPNKDYSNEQLESVKRQLEVIFPKRNWSRTEIALLERQMIIPKWELILVQRLYEIPFEPSRFLPASKLPDHEFLLSRRRQTMKTLLENWSDEVTRGLFFFRTDTGAAEARRRGWNLAEMRLPRDSS